MNCLQMIINPFIDETYFKSSNGLDASLDNKMIMPSIEKAQDFYILPLLGTALYNQLQTQIESGTVSADNTTLLDSYIAPCLSKYSLYEAIPKIFYKIENNGIFKRSAEFAEAIDFKDLTMVRQITKDDAEFFATKLTRYLQANPTVYPLYDNAGTSSDTVYPNAGTSYTTSIHFRKRTGYIDRRDETRGN
jgi:hypothetical protein